VCRSALCSPLLSPFGIESVPIFDHAPLCASPSQQPAGGFPHKPLQPALPPTGYMEIKGQDGGVERARHSAGSFPT